MVTRSPREDIFDERFILMVFCRGTSGCQTSLPVGCVSRISDTIYFPPFPFSDRHRTRFFRTSPTLHQKLLLPITTKMLRRTFMSTSSAAVALALITSTGAFAPPASTFTKPESPSTSFLSAFLPDLLTADATEEVLTAADYARREFWFYFFAGSGAGGIGIAQLPKIFQQADEARAKIGEGSSRGGASLDAGPLVGIYYDTEISKEDVADAIDKAPTAEFISSRSTSANYMASKGYIEQGDFLKEMEAKGCNPLASYILFNAISSGKGGVVSPVVYDDTLAAYREGSTSAGDVASAFSSDLNKFLAVKVAAFFGLVICLLVDLGFIASAGVTAWL